MKRKRFTEERIIAVLREHEADAKAADLARKHGVIPTCADPHPWAHWRIPMDMIFHGRSMRLFQASQQRATMSS